ncbi:MAG: hypothetical protein AAF830_04815 [Pseudomonadota bacterium]
MISLVASIALAAQGWAFGEQTLEYAMGEGAVKSEDVLTLMPEGKGPTAILTCDADGKIGAMLLLSATDPARSVDAQFIRRRQISGAILANGREVHRGVYPGLDRNLYQVKSRKGSAEIYNAVLRGDDLSFTRDGRGNTGALNTPPIDDAFRSFASACSARRS